MHTRRTRLVQSDVLPGTTSCFSGAPPGLGSSAVLVGAGSSSALGGRIRLTTARSGPAGSYHSVVSVSSYVPSLCRRVVRVVLRLPRVVSSHSPYIAATTMAPSSMTGKREDASSSEFRAARCMSGSFHPTERMSRAASSNRAGLSLSATEAACRTSGAVPLLTMSAVISSADLKSDHCATRNRMACSRRPLLTSRWLRWAASASVTGAVSRPVAVHRQHTRPPRGQSCGGAVSDDLDCVRGRVTGNKMIANLIKLIDDIGGQTIPRWSDDRPCAGVPQGAVDAQTLAKPGHNAGPGGAGRREDDSRTGV